MEQRLRQFLAALPAQAIAQRAAADTGRDEAEVAGLVETFRNEAVASFRLVEPLLPVPGQGEQRLLEVGAGLCLCSLFLRSEGFDITALEPALGGYSLFDTLRRLILEHHAGIDLPMLTCPAGDLRADVHGHFDLLFSNNVIEHIPDWQGALAAMLGVLGREGRMLHACPNYSVPYEPHYGVPVLRRLPGLSKRCFLPADADTEIWDSLNFISHRQVRRFARRHGCRVAFQPGLIYQALSRMHSDPLFRERHKGPVAVVADLLAKSGLLQLLRLLPSAMATPMVFEMQRDGGA